MGADHSAGAAAPSSQPPLKGNRRFRLFDRRVRWGPTWQGWIACLLLAVGGCFGALWGVYPFLAVNRPVKADVLVIEGWIPEYTFGPCISLIKSGAYKYVVTVGAPVEGASTPAPPDDTYAYVMAQRLRKLHQGPPNIDMAPTVVASRDRTFHCAIDLREWLSSHHVAPEGINVVTLGPHSRRSRLLFQKAFKHSVPVGIIALTDADYDPSEWWRYSEGVKEIVAESAAYIYARFLFHPDPATGS